LLKRGSISIPGIVDENVQSPEDIDNPGNCGFCGCFIVIAFCPRIALASLALAIASIITAQTILEIVTFFQARLYAGSIWALFDSGIKMLMALLLVFPWPSYTPWMVGLILGMNLMTTGCAVLIYSFYEPFEQTEINSGRCPCERSADD